MRQQKQVTLNLLSTGIPGLDEVLGGGLPEYSFNLIAGEPGSGKTTLVQQIIFANATVEQPAIYFTSVGEPPLKMLRYQQQMRFFDPNKVGTAVHYIDLSPEVVAGDLEALMQRIKREVQTINPRIVAADSFRTFIGTRSQQGGRELQAFLQDLSLFFTTWQATSFLVGEYYEREVRINEVFTVADGIIWLNQSRELNSVVRKIQVAKVRGQAPLPGLHTFRISNDGLEVFPRAQRGQPPQSIHARTGPRLSLGVPALDAMLGGGLPVGDATLVAGPSGTGKSVVSTHFIAAGAAQGERCVLAIFEEHPDDYVRRAKDIGLDLEAMVSKGDLRILYLRRLDLSLDETLLMIRKAVEEIGAKRLVFDSLTGFEVALAPTFKADFQESLYHMIGVLTQLGVSLMMTIEVPETFDTFQFSPHAISFLTENIIFLRYAELRGELRKVLAVVKMRRSKHSAEFRAYEITERGLVIRETLRDWRGLLSDKPQQTNSHEALPSLPGLTAEEARVLVALTRSNESEAAALAQELTLEPATLTRALNRLVALNYVLMRTQGDNNYYRPLSSDSGR